MYEEPLTVLLVEDSPADARLIRETLVEDGVTHLDIEHVQLVSEAIERLRAGGIDAVLLDLFLPDNMGPDTVQKVIEVSPRTPVVVLTGVADKEAALASVRHGAQDYLVKGQITADVLVRTIHYAVERKRFEAALASQPLQPRVEPGPPSPSEPETEPAHGPEEPEEAPATEDGDADDEAQATGSAGRARATNARQEHAGPSGDEAFVRELRSARLPEARARGLARVLDDYIALAGHDPAPGPCDTARAFDHALARLQERILEDEMHVRRYPLPPVFADELLLSHLFEAAMAAALALGGQRELAVHLSCERAGNTMRFTLVAGPTGDAPPRASTPADRGTAPGQAVALVDYPELALAARLAERLGGSLEASEGARPGVHALRFELPTVDASVAPRRGAEGAGSVEEK